MISQRQLFLKHVGQTSDSPVGIEIEHAEGIYIYDTQAKQYIDLVAGVSVSNLGHCHPAVTQAVKQQVDKYMHLMVYGEYIQSPQVAYAELLSSLLPEPLSSVYFVNSGSEANEGAMKLAKRYTGRSEIAAFKNAYHGSTHGAMSIMSDSYFSQAFRPLLPGIKFLSYNKLEELKHITQKTAAVFVESIQAEGGIIPAEYDFMQALRKRCTQTGTLLIIDEVQTGFRRTGKLFGFMHYDIVPDIITIAKGMGGGMPIGAFVASKTIMDSLKNNPVLGHITTFGGHPVSAAAALATLKIIQSFDEQTIYEKEKLYRQLLGELDGIADVRGKGLFLSVKPKTKKTIQEFVQIMVKNGLLTDWFLFDETRFRIAPPLLISNAQIQESVKLIEKSLKD
jgi:acetylornithine/succinyldiaminopimelate/putrescine aminotransferase